MKFPAIKLNINAKNLMLIGLLFAALILRLVGIGNAPRGLHADEMSFLINAESLLTTGLDEDGRAWPLLLTSFIDPKPALYSYLQLPFVAVLGATPTAARLPAVILGVVSIWLCYVLVSKTWSEKMGLLSAAVLTLSPWHNLMSRSTQEVIMSLVFVLISLVILQFWLSAKELVFRQHAVLLGLMTVSCFFAVYSYHSAKVLLPLMVLVWVGWEWWRRSRRDRRPYVFLALLPVTIAVIASTLLSGSLERFTVVGFLSNQQPQLLLEEQIREATGITPLLLLRMFYNKVFFYGRSILNVYAQHFSPEFLFLNGGQPWRYFIPYHGLLAWPELLLVPLGLVVWLRTAKSKHIGFVFLVLLFLAPFPAALTYIETPSVIRAFPMVVPLAVFTALALIWLWQRRRRLFVFPILLTVIMGYGWSQAYFWHQLFVQQPQYQPWHRNRPYEVIADWLVAHQGEYDRISVTNDLRPLYAYFIHRGLIPITTAQAYPLARNQKEYQLGNFSFNRGICDLGDHASGTYFIAEIHCPPDGRRLLTTITYDDGLPVYGIWTEATETQSEN